jgi:hypothetical protein
MLASLPRVSGVEGSTTIGKNLCCKLDYLLILILLYPTIFLYLFYLCIDLIYFIYVFYLYYFIAFILFYFIYSIYLLTYLFILLSVQHGSI